MCGIFAYVGPECDAGALVFAALKDLEYRGYDSWGITICRNGRAITVKDAGKLAKLPPRLEHTSVAVGHTRWATTGSVTKVNAHPHQDCQRKISVIHNGIIENFEALREELLDTGHRFLSETDTEVAAHLLEEELRRTPGPLHEALRRVSLRLEGLNALVAVSSENDELAASKTGSPLYIGIGSSAHFLASDPAALVGHAQSIVRVADGQVVALRADSFTIRNAQTDAIVEPEIEALTLKPEAASLRGHEHYLGKEIAEQPALLRKIAAEDDSKLGPLREAVERSRKIWFTGCGTAYHEGLLGAHFWSKYGKQEAQAVYAHELEQHHRFIRPDDLLFALSQSGETIDLLDAVRALEPLGARTAALVNVPSSSLAYEADVVGLLDAGPEKAVLSTKAFSVTVAYLAALSGMPSEEHAQSLHRAAEAIEQLLSEDCNQELTNIAAEIAQVPSLFVLGSGGLYPAALEAALKIKEVSYIHAEGFPSAELKHGVIALISDGTPCIVLAPKHDPHSRTLIGAGELKSRGARIIGISPEAHPLFDTFIRVPGTGLEFLLGSVAATQILAYKLALARGLDPDKPRNLAKSVTVR